MSKRRKARSGSVVERTNWPMVIGFLAPAVFLILVFFYYPSIRGIVLSFQKVSIYNLTETPFYGLNNYRNLLSMVEFWMFWRNTFVWVFGCVAAEFVIGFTVALLLRREFAGKRVYEGIIFMPWALSSFTVGVIFKWIFNGTTGLLNDILIRLHLIKLPIGFLSSHQLALPSVMVAKVWTGMAFFSIVIIAALKTIPKELYESAEIDGANAVQSFFAITLPSIRMILLFTVLLRMIQTFGAADLIFSMTGGGPAGASHTVSSFIMTEIVRGTDYGRVQAAGMLTWLFLLVCSLGYLYLTNSLKKGDV